MAHTAAPTARTLSALATKATGVRFTAMTTRLTGTVRVALAAAPDNGPARVREAQAALAAAGYRARLIADGWQLAVSAQGPEAEALERRIAFTSQRVGRTYDEAKRLALHAQLDALRAELHTLRTV